MTRVLVARSDNLGDVLLSGPAVRAVAASGAEVIYLCNPVGRPAAQALPGVGEMITARLPWIDAAPEAATRPSMEALIRSVEASAADQALIFTSFHQTPLPLALLLRMAGVKAIAAISVDYPGSLLDLRHRVDEGLHEVERNLSLAAAAGYPLPADDERRLQILLPEGRDPLPFAEGSYVVVHPGASVPARAWSPTSSTALVRRLNAAGWNVVVTGASTEKALCERVTAGGHPAQTACLAGATDLEMLATLLAHSAAVICGNTGPAHLAAAVGAPVVSLYAPTVPAQRWHPWMVPHVLLGDQRIACAGCRAKVCPVAGHPCLAGVGVEEVLSAVEALSAGRGTRTTRAEAAG